MATLLVSTTAVLVQNLRGIWGADPGFEPAKLLTFAVSLDARRYEKPHQRRTFFEGVETDLRRLAPAAVCRLVPMGNEGSSTRFSIEGKAVEDARQLPVARYNAVGAEFFSVMKRNRRRDENR